jgi:hypothetical protein
MRWCTGAWLLVILLAVPMVMMAHGQSDIPRTEIYGGFSRFSHVIGSNGWIASLSHNPWQHFGLEADFSGHWSPDSHTY